MQSLHSKKISLRIIIGVLSIFIFLVLNIFGVRTFLKGQLHDILTPILSLSSNKGSQVSQILNLISNLSSVREDIEKNKEKVFSLEAENAYLRHLKKENKELREILDLSVSVDNKGTVVDIIMKDFKGGEWILINKGYSDGINEGDIAISAQNVLIGSVYKVTKESAYIQLTTSEESVYHVLLSGTDNNAVAKGSHGNSIKVEYIDSLAKVQEGDVFLYNNIESIELFAKKPSIGVVQEIFVPDDKLSQSVYLVPLYDIKLLNYVLIFHKNI